MTVLLDCLLDQVPLLGGFWNELSLWEASYQQMEKMEWAAGASSLLQSQVLFPRDMAFSTLYYLILKAHLEPTRQRGPKEPALGPSKGSL